MQEKDAYIFEIGATWHYKVLPFAQKVGNLQHPGCTVPHRTTTLRLADASWAVLVLACKQETIWWLADIKQSRKCFLKHLKQ